MFADAIEIVGGYTRPIFTIARRYYTSEIEPGCATMFFVNNDGWAVTTKHTAKLIIESAQIQKRYQDFKNDRAKINFQDNFEDELKFLEIKHKMNEQTVAQMKVNFFDCVDSLSGFECKLSGKYDLAAIHLQGFSQKFYRGEAIFAGDPKTIRPGKFLCRLGYPFPEFQNYTYDVETDEILWTNEGHKFTSRFPADGMMSRLIAGPEGIFGIEMNCGPMLGLNGAPLFDEKGLICGMQTGVSKLRLTQCLHASVITKFLESENIPYYTDTEHRDKPNQTSN